MRSSRTAGFAFATALTFMLICMLSVAIVISMGYYNRTLANDLVRTTQAQYAAEAGLEAATKVLWNDRLVPYPSSIRTLAFYRGKLNPDVSNGTSYKELTGSGGLISNNTLSDGSTFKVTVSRTDYAKYTKLTLQSTGTAPGSNAVRIINQSFTIQPIKFTGLDYALLSNNINCTFCHTRITSMEAAYGTTPNNTTRVKVGTLETLEMRVSSAANQWDAVDTLVGGSVYTRGQVFNQNRAAFDVSTTDDLRFNKLNSTGTLNYDTSKTIQNNAVRGQQNDCSVSTNCQTSNQNFYSNYPTGNGIDGSLPSNFPLPVPDANNDKYISNAEWAAAIQTDYEQNESVYGSLTPVSGGTAAFGAGSAVAYKGTSVSESGTTKTVTTGATWTSVGSKLSSGTNARGVPGNLLLSGTVKLDGTLFVDGDVVIGKDFKVQGKGKIVARGNVYVSGDIQYDCTTPTNPTGACDYSNLANPDLPQLGLAAVGNVMIGDYMSQQYASRPDLLNSAKNISDFKTAYVNKEAVPYTVAEIANFNKLEYDKAVKDSSYIPRFYKMRDTDPVIVYTGTGEQFSGYQGGDVKYLGCGSVLSLVVSQCSNSDPDPAILSRARIASMAPTGGWLTESQVKQAWIDNIETPTRPQVNSLVQVGSKIAKPLQIDASLYSANATFALARGCSNVDCKGALRSNIDGRISMNGSMISADLGLLASGSGGKKDSWINGQRDTGLDIHYDSRAAGLFKLDYGDNVGLAKSDYALVGKE